jgi:hypothetical protein
MQEAQLGRAGWKLAEAESGAEVAEAAVAHSMI